LLKNYDSANAFSEEFLKQLTEQVINPTGESIVEYEKAIQDILSLGGGEDIEKALSNLEKELIEENKKLQEEAKELTESEVLANAIDSAFSEDMEQVFEYYEEVKNSLDKIIAALDAFMKANDIVP
jgi:valyl-tRNA synthetase